MTDTLTLDPAAFAKQLQTNMGFDTDSPMSEQIAAQMTAKVDAMGIPSRLAELEDAMASRAPEPEKAKADALGAILNPHAHNPLAIGAALDGKFETFQDFMKATLSMTGRRNVDPRLRLINEGGDIRADLTGEEIELGGALVPEEFRSQLMMLMLQPNSIRSMATVLPMGSSTLTVPAIRDESHSGKTVYGGVRSYWTEAGEDITESEPNFSQIRLTAKGLLTLTTINNTLIMDSFTTLTPLIGKLFMGASDWEQERTFIRGTGAGEPLGILNSPAAVTISGGTAALTTDKIGIMEARLLPECDPYAVWMIHPSVRKDLYSLTNNDVQVWHAPLAQRMPSTLNGRPIIINEHMSATGTAGNTMLVDWRMYLIGDRQAMSMAASEHSKFSSNQTQIRGVQRLDGQPWLDTALTPAQGTDTLSPFIVH